jgi:hypothetical protein
LRRSAREEGTKKIQKREEIRMTKPMIREEKFFVDHADNMLFRLDLAILPFLSAT